MFYRRNLPHIWHPDHPIFITWRLHGSLPRHRAFPGGTLSSGQVFAAMDRPLDEARTGPFYLRRPEIADMVVQAFQHNAQVLNQYVLHAFVAMTNHVHLLVTARAPLAHVTKSVKTFTARQANAMLARSGQPFWQHESYDHMVRDAREFEKIRSYIEENPVRAGLAPQAREFRWSSAGWATRRSAPPWP